MRPQLATLVLLAATSAAAERPTHERIVEASPFVAAAGSVSNIIFLNRCRGGCTITGGTQNDARTNTSTIPNIAVGATVTISEFDFPGGDADWNTLVACVRDLYRPYAVEITDVDPGPDVLHHESIVAGTDTEIGLNGALGVGVVDPNCNAYNNGISYAFANAHAKNAAGLEDLCWTVAQEAGHTYGLDHVFDCHDPMTYLSGCERKYFRNEDYICGEFSERQCRCGSVQNSHDRLFLLFGKGSDIPVPDVELIGPANGSTITSGTVIEGTMGSVRGIGAVELWVNGHKWDEQDGPPLDRQTGAFGFNIPSTLPDGVQDIEVRVQTDLGEPYAPGVASVTVTKGVPCSTADTCLAGQICEAGKCFWEPATGQLGDTCDFNEFCVTGRCEGVCTESCMVGIDGDCPSGFACDPVGGGLCFAAGGTETGGCCQAGGSVGGGIVRLLAGLGLMGLLVRRRRSI